MPPAGSHPVRAAMNTSTSDVSSGGSDTNTTDTPLTMADVRVPILLPERMPSEMPSSVAIASATRASTAVLPAAPITSGPTGRL
jgi:hypothetical protein